MHEDTLPEKKSEHLINTFSRVPGYKINGHTKTVLFLYTKKLNTEKEIKEMAPFRIGSKINWDNSHQVIERPV